MRRPDAGGVLIVAMAITHFRAQIIQATRGPVAAAAYRHRAEMFDAANNQLWDYRGKSDLVHAELALPTGAPTWAKQLTDRAPAEAAARLWNAAADAETRYDGQAAREIVIALPMELDRAQNIALMRNFVSGELTSRGFAADWVYHEAAGNPHVHLMHTLRPLVETGFGAKTIVQRDVAGNPVRNAAGKLVYDRFIGSRDDFKALRLAWGDYVNCAYANAGYATRIDMRSYADRGLDILPGRHMGPALAALRKRGLSSDAVDAFIADDEQRAATFDAHPELAIEITAATQATFTASDVARTVATYVTDPLMRDDVAARAMAAPEVLLLRAAETTLDRPAIHSTHEQIETEQRIVAASLALARLERASPRPEIVVQAILQTETSLGAGARLSDGQLAALDYMLEPPAIRTVVGLAGTGKSTLLAAAHRAWASSGAVVHGAAVSGIAARGLQTSSEIPSRTVASWLNAWAAGSDGLGRGDVFVLDEAGMIGSADMCRIIENVARAGAKLVLVGDPEQLAPIAAGAPLRAIIDTSGNVVLSDIRRQRLAEHRVATAAFAAGNISDGLAVYRREGAIRPSQFLDGAIDDLVAAYVDTFDAERSSLALAYTNAHVERLNGGIRAALKDRGLLGSDASFRTSGGERLFAVGDRILFLETRTVTIAGERLRLDNGAIGRVVSAETDRLGVRLDDGRMVALTPDVYAAVSHGYAATVHKSQGVTVDDVHVLATGHFDRARAYVAFSRHRSRLTIYEPQAALGASLESVLSRREEHGNAIATDDYRERRGLGAFVPEREKGALTAATRRALLSGLGDRLAAAIAPLAMKTARPVALGDIPALRRDLARVSSLRASARRLARAIAHLMAERLTPTAIAQRLTSGETSFMPRHAFKSIASAASRAYARLLTSPARGAPVTAFGSVIDEGKTAGRNAVAAPAPVPAPPPVSSHCRLSYDETARCYRFTFPYLRAANEVATRFGLAFDAETKSWRLMLDRVPDGVTPAEIQARIAQVFEAREKRIAHTDGLIAPMKSVLHNMALTAGDGRIAVRLPVSGPGAVGHDAMLGLGARFVESKGGNYYSMPAPLPTDMRTLMRQLRELDARIPEPPARHELRTLGSSHPGYELSTDGAVYRIVSSPLPNRDAVLAPLQPRYLSPDVATVRADLFPLSVVRERLGALGTYYRSVAVPPTSPRDGLDVDRKELAGLVKASPGEVAVDPTARRVASMVAAHLANGGALPQDVPLADALMQIRDRVAAGHVAAQVQAARHR
jgi:Ti-type conjugative transfer relaxase TraA